MKSYFRNGEKAQDKDVFIAVMGTTGSGKSSFISLLAEPGTQAIYSYLYKYDNNTNVYLIDTPGFDDTNRDDSDVLREIAFWLSDSLMKKIKLSGMFYFHPISDPRMQGSAMKNILMFKKLLERHLNNQESAKQLVSNLLKDKKVILTRQTLAKPLTATLLAKGKIQEIERGAGEIEDQSGGSQKRGTAQGRERAHSTKKDRGGGAASTATGAV
ncbi:hypothetical protein N7495_002872 [Penicillium taxi]|uniref:uncharacterized protein n=1 Tax=Penicillium taxi TaxID=168475 RepID=UPI002544E846|nr:uncharacterized protein N7495_002872 [Penicillium taxi]KAJ5902344.1 hypothetical protein N7495_002872 [Penicillium taxi]